MRKHYKTLPFVLFMLVFACTKNNDPVRVLVPPAPPASLTAEAKSASEISLAWTDQSTNENGFKIERKTSSSNFEPIADLGKDITSYRDQGLAKNTTYFYRVYAYNTAGKSPTYSNTAEATTADDIPAAATSLQAVLVSFNEIDLRWSDQADNENGYKVERKIGSGEFTVIATLGSNVNGYSDKNLAELTEYTYRVYPYNNTGNGPKSNESTASTRADIMTSLVAFYPFSGNPLDSSGNNNHGTIQGNVTLTADRQGRANMAYAFDGNTASFINVPMSNSLRIKNEITIAAWILMDGGYYNPRVISNEATGFDRYFMAVAGTANTKRNLEATIAGQSQGSGFCCGGTNGIEVPALSWHFIVFTVESSGLAKLYLDGVLQKSSQGTLLANPNYGPNLNIGRNSHPAYDAWGGKLDDIRIYNRALTQAQIQYLFNL